MISMTTSDTFARFVDVLAAALDEHDASGEALASRMHLSPASHDRPYDLAVERAESLADLRDKLADVGPAFLTQVHEIVDEGRLDETFVDALCDPPEIFTYGGMIAHVLTFAAHRRVLVLGARPTPASLISAPATPCGGWPNPSEHLAAQTARRSLLTSSLTVTLMAWP
jgi:hypothetical protein